MDSQPHSAPAPSKYDAVVRWAFIFYLSWILCPIRYCVPSRANADNTWFFALNYAAAHHLYFGRDLIWTWGPLAYLLVPFDIGSNLVRGLAFQAGLWILLTVVLADLLLRNRIPLRNVALFSFFVALFSIGQFQELNPGNLMLPVGLILLVHFQLHGGVLRLLAAFFLLGLLPLFQVVGAVTAAGIIAGFVLHRLLNQRAGSWREAALSLLVPLVVATLGGALVFPSFGAAMVYLRASRELASGYAIAMSVPGSRMEVFYSVAAFALVLAAFAAIALRGHKTVSFFGFLLAAPLILELRHGLVRQDASHVTQFFCFAGLALALLALAISLESRAVEIAAVVVACTFSVLWWQTTTAQNFPHTAAVLTGENTPRLLSDVLHPQALISSLRNAARQNAAEFGLDPALRQIVGQQSIAFLSLLYSNALGEDLNLTLLPCLQNYSAYTPYLDGLNSDLIASRGPQFLAFELLAIDDRHAWTEAPATWDAVYRWYDTRAVGDRYLLLQRRAQPRFDHFELVESRSVGFDEVIPIPKSDRPVFWTIHCSLRPAGKLRQLLFRVPEVTMTLGLESGRTRIFRAVIPVLSSPVPGNNMPLGLAQYASVLSNPSDLNTVRQWVRFSGPGAGSYQSGCELQFLHISRE